MRFPKHRAQSVLNLFVLLAMLIGSAVFVVPISAITHTVTSEGDSGPGSLRQAIADANPGDKIIFDPYLSNKVLSLASTLVIEKDLTIDGSDLDENVIISGGNDYRVFYINPGVIVTLDSLSIYHGKENQGGGIFNNQGTLTVTRCDISHNWAESYGGGIFNNYGILTVTGSDISHNWADSSYGGGIHTTQGTLLVSESNFSENEAFVGGGGISNSGSLTVEESTFSKNESKWGGGIYNYTNSTISLKNCTLSGNHASGGGGGIYNYGSLTVEESTLSGNEATGPSGNGGGIYNDQNGSVSLLKTTFSKNIAVQKGGGIYNDNTLTVEESTLSENEAAYGGGIYNFSNGILDLTNSTLSGNHASGGGGGIYNDSTLTVEESTLFNNGSKRGGGIYNHEGIITVTESDLSGNRAGLTTYPGGGGGILNDNGTLTITHSTITNNIANVFAGGEGGGIYNIEGNLTLINSTLSNNVADVGGGICSSGILTMNECNLYNNKTDWGSGGGIFIGNNAVAEITRTIFTKNSTESRGGGIATWGNNSLIVTDCTFIENEAHVGGGISIDFGSNATVSGSTLNGNSATSGGGVVIYPTCTLDLTNSTLYGNSASEKGGGILNPGTLNLINSTLFGNAAAVAGGVYSTGELNYANTIIASGSGGFCYNDGGTIGTNTHNLVQDGSCGASMTGDPLLGPLADNGGPTLTHALLPGSPAIDAGHAAICAAPPVNNLDQRGVTRPQGAVCDIGAFEFTKLDQVITFTSQAPGDAVVGGPSYTPTAAGGDSGNPILFTIDASAASVCAIDGGQVAFIGAGTCVINANQAGNRYFNAADQSQQSFEVAMPEEEGYALFLPLVVK